MSRAIVFRRIAQIEYDEAVTWYETERAGLGLEFMSAIDAVLAVIARHPSAFRQVRGPVRRAVIRRFPYTIHFLNEADRIVVLAVFHGARDPKELGGRE